MDIKGWQALCAEFVDYAGGFQTSGNITYAASYAKAGINMQDADEIETQALYVLSNLRHYNSPAQKTFKARFREFANG